ncbi:hypothetical protein R3P38DRAFT_3420421, partial [Favolaschia claudopus]
VEMMDVDDDTIESELHDLHRDSIIQADMPRTSLVRRASFVVTADVDDRAREVEETAEEDDDDDVEEDADKDDSAVYEKEKPSQIVFDDDAMAIIHAGLAAVQIPAWIDRPPVNLGEKAHGKLKADNWLVLITVFFPLILPELWWGKPRYELKLLDNLHDLVGATNILFSETLDLTMLRQMCRRGRLLASMHDSIQTGDAASSTVKAMRILYDPVSTSDGSPEHLSPIHESAHNSSGSILEEATYSMLLDYWNQTYSPPYVHRAQFAFELMDMGINVFPTRAVEHTNFSHKTRPFSIFAKHAGGSSISFRHPATGRKDFGYIQEIWTQALQGECRTYLIIQPHTRLSSSDEAKTPLRTHQRFKSFARYTNPQHARPQLVIELRHIIAHVPFHRRPKGTYGIKHAITLFVDSLEKGRD